MMKFWSTPAGFEKVARGVYRTPNTKALDERVAVERFSMAPAMKCEYETILAAFAAAATHYGHFVAVDVAASKDFRNALKRHGLYEEHLQDYLPELLRQEHLVREESDGVVVYSLHGDRLHSGFNPFGINCSRGG